MRELSLHILDIARNSIEAGAGKVEIRISEDTRQDVLRFAVLDDGPGMERNLLPVVTDPFFTSKKKRKKIGLGLSLLKAAVDRCDGSFNIETSPGKGTAVTAVFRRSHIDRAPLGDLPGTITALLMNPELNDLIYSHEVDGQKFSFSLESLKESFG